jgi:hypothetical protein
VRQVNTYAPYAYDATYAIAHALHYLIENLNVTSIVGSELYAALINNVSFPGVTGTIELFDGSANPDRLYHGDRRVGIAYDVLNYQSGSIGLTRVARWIPGAATYSGRWFPDATPAAFVFSTGSTPPPDVVVPTCAGGQIVQGGVCLNCPPGTYEVNHAVCSPIDSRRYGTPAGGDDEAALTACPLNSQVMVATSDLPTGRSTYVWALQPSRGGTNISACVRSHDLEPCGCLPLLLV